MRREESALDFLTNLDVAVALYRGRGGNQDEETASLTAEGGTEAPSTLSPSNNTMSSISQTVQSQVEDALWLDKLKKQYEDLEEMRRRAGAEQDRCAVCTLPYGTCQHTQTWLVDRVDDTKDVVERELDELMSFIGAPVEVETAPVEEDVDMTSIRWVHLDPAPSDKIGTTYTSVYEPRPRGWHSCTHLGQWVVLFGGFRYKRGKVPQPFGPATTKEDVEYLSDLVIFDTIARSWHASPRREHSPGGRYGHAAAAIDDDRMLIYGGRSGGGRFLSDTWIYTLTTDEWLALEINSASPPPSPRVFSSAAPHAGLVYLFGGTDGVDNFGDLWIFRPEEMRWERTVAVGMPPSPRYGHKLIAIREGKNTNTDTNASHAHMSVAHRGRLAVVGGCTVSPQSEVVGMAMSSQEIKSMLDLGNGLQNNYLAEGLTAHLGGSHLAASADVVGAGAAGGVKGLYKAAASVVGQLHELEVQTREAEKNLVTQYHVLQASKQLKLQKAKHPDPHLDVIFLDIHDLAWKPQIYPPISGEIPSSRMHFGCVSMGGHIIVVGGTKPSSLGHAASEMKHTRILSLDLDSFRWTTRHSEGSTEALEVPLQIADSDIMRAKLRVEAERDRGRSLGARNGVTVELAEAQAVLNVCEWRRKMLLRERDNLRDPPPPRWGASLEAVGCRAYFVGGWCDEAEVPKGESYILDLEHELERRRREMDEFHLKLERDRQIDLNNSNLQNMQSAYELRAMLMAEKANALKERALMGMQDLISSIPPLSTPRPVRLVKANEHSMWVEWDRIRESVLRLPIDPASVRYNLYMVNSYQNLTVQDRVLVLPLGAPGSMGPEDEDLFAPEPSGDDDNDDISVLSTGSAQVKKRAGKGKTPAPSSALSVSSTASPQSTANRRPENNFKEYVGKGFPGEITGITPEGRFSVSFDDGTFEGSIHRRRIKLERPVYPDRVIRFNIDGTVQDNSSSIEEEHESSDDEEDLTSAAKKAAKRREQAQREKYSHLLTELNRESLTIRPDMAWAAQKRIMSKLKAREAAIARVKKIHPSYARSSSTSRLGSGGGSSIGGSMGSPGSRASASASALSTANEEGGGGEDEEEEDEDEDESESDGDEDPDARAAAKLEKARSKLLSGDGGRASRKRFEPTIKVPPEYSLMYSGNACSWEVTGLVPLEALRRDPKLTVAVTFVLQVAGADLPSFEFSKLSPPAVFHTRTGPSVEELLRGINTLGEDAEEEDETQDLLERLRRSAAAAAGGEDEVKAGGGKLSMTAKAAGVSRTKKQLITAIVEGNRVAQMEKQGSAVTSLGMGDYFL